MFDDILRAWGMPADFIERHWRRSAVSGRTQAPTPGVPSVAEVAALLHQGLRADRVSVSTAGRLHHPAERTGRRHTYGGRKVNKCALKWEPAAVWLRRVIQIGINSLK